MLPDCATVDVSAWTAPVLEAEIAVHVGRGYGAAIELADVDFPPEDVDAILASGIYHRHVVLGPPVARSLDGFRHASSGTTKPSRRPTIRER